MGVRSMAATDVDLLAEQLSHTLDLVKADLRMMELRVRAAEETVKDHEERLRAVTDSATQFKVLAGLATGGGLLSIISLLDLIFRR